ncbi:hypothetical protein LTR85_002617 [Meristemomyces frigidus]|nr:hypothetical protein LTR85_002617 [Meristemomyces frigidus]
MSGQQHDGSRPPSGHSEEDVDSAATTLLASAVSSKANSFDKDRKYADIELERFDDRETKRRKDVHDAGDSPYNSGAEEDGEGAQEDEHLLAHDTAALNAEPDAAETAINVDGEQPPPPPPVEEKRQQVSWSSLPKKTQLAILTLARLSEPLSQTSLQAYLFYQLKSFHAPGTAPPSDAKVASQVGILAAAFTGAQFMTAIMWGRLADTEMFGRKRVILIGLLGSCISLLGFGFSGSYVPAVLWRILGGMLNGNMGVMRTMISEMVKEKKFQSRAFLLLPMTFNIGVIIGPLLGGLLADPVGSYPGIFGPGGSIGGKDGVWWLTKWPYALPNVVSATFLFGSALGVFFGLEETLEGLKDRPDYGLRLSRWVLRTLFRRNVKQDYAALSEHEPAADDVEMSAVRKHQRKPSLRRKLPFRRIWTPNVLFVLLAHGLLAMHVGTFNSLWFVFLSTPRYAPNTSNNDGDSTTLHLPPGYHPHAPFTFTGGLALPPRSIGTALAILGVIGISLQLLLYPRLSFYLGTITSYRYSLLLFPIAYFLTPFLAVIPSTLAAPGQASGFLVWIGITIVLCFQVTARTFALPSTAILVNNSSPHPSVLGTIHGIAQSVSSATRTVGPVLVSWLYGVGLNRGVVGMAWWSMGGVAIVGAIAAWWVREGDGHEIWLEGEKEEEDGKG